MLRKHPLARLVPVLVVLSACADAVVAPEAVPSGPATMEWSASLSATLPVLDYEVPTRHMVVFDDEAPASFDATVAALGGRVFFASDAVGIAGVEGLTDAAAAQLGTAPGVYLVEAEPTFPAAQPVALAAPEMADAPASPANPAGAFFYPRQWNMRAIQADAAWAGGRTGSPDVTVAILDTGIGYIHADLIGRVDLARSVSFVAVDDLYVQFFFPGAHLVADIGYHGTHVAATVASNGLVAAGVTSGATLMGVKVCSVATGGCPGLSIFQGIEHAVENGADVINMSLGGTFAMGDYPGYVSVLAQLFNYAKAHEVTLVVSAGNESIDLDRNTNVPVRDENGDIIDRVRVPSLFKTFCDATHVVCVSATGPTSAEGVNGAWTDVDALAVYSNYGRSAVDVGAPGGNSGGAVWAACSTFSLVISVCRRSNTFVVGLSGTSMASPHVAALAALAVEDVGRDVGAVRDYIRNSADPLGGGNTAAYGKGRINVATATGTD